MFRKILVALVLVVSCSSFLFGCDVEKRMAEKNAVEQAKYHKELVERVRSDAKYYMLEKAGIEQNLNLKEVVSSSRVPFEELGLNQEKVMSVYNKALVQKLEKLWTDVLIAKTESEFNVVEGQIRFFVDRHFAWVDKNAEASELQKKVEGTLSASRPGSALVDWWIIQRIRSLLNIRGGLQASLGKIACLCWIRGGSMRLR